jgi:hypothetical protein
MIEVSQEIKSISVIAEQDGISVELQPVLIRDGGGGAVDSVNGEVGVVVLDTSDIAEVTNLYYTETRVSANTDVAANSLKVGVTDQEANTINSEPIGDEAQVLQVVSMTQAQYDLITPVATTFYIING